MKIYTDIITRTHFDALGNIFRGGLPSHAFGARDTIEWQLTTNSELANPTAWTKATLPPGTGALIGCDNDFRHYAQGTLNTPLTAGAVTEVKVNTGLAITEIAPGGRIIIGTEALAYESTATTGTVATFTLADGSTLSNSYAAGVTVDIQLGYYFIHAYDAGASNPATGYFRFDIVVDSPKLRAAMAYDNVAALDGIAGLELLLFTGDLAAGTAIESGRYLIDGYSITGGIIDLESDPYVPETLNAPFTAIIQALVASGVDGITPSIDPVTKHWLVGETDTGVVAEGVDGEDGEDANLSDADPLPLGTTAPGDDTTAARADHVHPTTGLVTTSMVGASDGVASLIDGKVPASQLPTSADVNMLAVRRQILIFG